MAANPLSLRIGVFGPEEAPGEEPRGCSLWQVGYAASLTAAGATPVLLGQRAAGRSWSELLHDVLGLVWAGRPSESTVPTGEEERLCNWCRKNSFPLLAVDGALQVLNSVFGGTLHLDLAAERPEALQHRHPPEKGLRHAIEVVPGTRLSEIYGDGEIVVNSEHRRGVARVARGFRVGASALDGVVEAIEAENDKWFAVGVQWRPASASASGLDIQLFRGLIDAAGQRLETLQPRQRIACTAAA
jgi:putative glutamine amidotransferase